MTTSRAAIVALRRSREDWLTWRASNPGRVDLSGADLSHLDLVGRDFRDVSLHHANLTDSKLSYSRLYNCDLERAELSGAEAKGCVFTDCSLHDAQLNNANLVGANLAGAMLAGANLASADLCVANLSGAQLGRSTLDGAKVWDTAFCNVDLSSASLIDLEYQGPCDIGTMTIERTAAGLAGDGPGLANFEHFLRGCGARDHWLELFRTLVGQPIQWYSVFISYSREDEVFARRLYDQLQGRGIRCWLDREKLHPGDRILDSINEAIRVHDRLLICCSRRSLTSWWVKDEIHKALERERKESLDIIIPIDLDGYLLREWSDGLASAIRSRAAGEFEGWEQSNALFEEQFQRVLLALQPRPANSELKLTVPSFRSSPAD